MRKEGVVELAGGDLHFWLEQDASVMIKAVTRYGDPVELSERELDLLIKELSRMQRQLDEP